MAGELITVEDPVGAIAEWFAKLSSYVSTENYEAARKIVADDVAAFGTQADAVVGLDLLQSEQWEQVWPRTSGFKVLMETVRSGGDAGIAWGMATWTSFGYDEKGLVFDRPGRATIVLRRDGARWEAVHTHFSLFRGVRQESYGELQA